MSVYCERQDNKCVHYYGGVCYIPKYTLKMNNECEPVNMYTDKAREIMIIREANEKKNKTSYYSGGRNYSDDGYYRSI